MVSNWYWWLIEKGSWLRSSRVFSFIVIINRQSCFRNEKDWLESTLPRGSGASLTSTAIPMCYSYKLLRDDSGLFKHIFRYSLFPRTNSTCWRSLFQFCFLYSHVSHWLLHMLESNFPNRWMLLPTTRRGIITTGRWVLMAVSFPAKVFIRKRAWAKYRRKSGAPGKWHDLSKFDRQSFQLFITTRTDLIV